MLPRVILRTPAVSARSIWTSKLSTTEGSSNQEIDTDKMPPITVISSLADYTEVAESGKKYLIHFTAPWSDPCQHIAPLFFHLATQEDINSNVKFAVVDVAARTDVAKRANIKEVPSLGFGMGRDNGHQFAGADSQRLMRVVDVLLGKSSELLSVVANPKMDAEYLSRRAKKNKRNKSQENLDIFEDFDVDAYFNALPAYRDNYGENAPDICGVTGLHADDIPTLESHEIPDFEELSEMIGIENLDLTNKADVLKIVDLMKKLKEESSTSHVAAISVPAKAEEKSAESTAVPEEQELMDLFEQIRGGKVSDVDYDMMGFKPEDLSRFGHDFKINLDAFDLSEEEFQAMQDNYKGDKKGVLKLLKQAYSEKNQDS